MMGFSCTIFVLDVDPHQIQKDQDTERNIGETWSPNICSNDMYAVGSEPPRGRVSAELSKPVKRKGAMCVVLV